MAIEKAENQEISDTSEETSEAAPLPASLLEGKTVNPGDVVRIEVVTAPDEDGQWTGKYASSPAPLKRDSTMDEMAARYKPAKQEMT